MIGIFYIPVLIFSAVGIIWMFRRILKSGSDENAAPRRRLDIAGAVTNGVLGVLYIPLGLLASFGGMAGEAYINRSTPVQDALIAVIEFLGPLSPFMMAGSIITSVLLRRQGRSVPSFWIQFAGLGYAGLILILIALLDVVG